MSGSKRGFVLLAGACLLSAALLVWPAESRAGDGAGDAGKKAAGKKAAGNSAAGKKAAGKEAGLPKGPSLAFRHTYADALLEARIRNLPVFVSRHKDF